MQVPNGFDGIISTFGDVRQYVDSTGVLSPEWNSLYLGIANLPFSIPLAWNKAVSVTRITCHLQLIPFFEQAFVEIQGSGLQDEIHSYGGCFAYRAQRTGSKLSTHSWGIAIDLNPDTNQQGTRGDMSPAVVEIFKQYGFEWGGSWPGKVRDDMHFQFCTGY